MLLKFFLYNPILLLVNKKVEDAKMLEKEYEFYTQNKDALLKKYLNKVVVIVGTEIIGAYDNIADAISNSVTKYPLGSFLAKEVKENETPIIFRSRVRYAK